MAKVKPTPNGSIKKKTSLQMPASEWAFIERALLLTGEGFATFVRRACRQEALRVLRQFEVESSSPVIASSLEPVLQRRMSEALQGARFQFRPGELPAPQAERIDP